MNQDQLILSFIAPFLATAMAGCRPSYVASSCPWDSSVKIEKVVVDAAKPSATVYATDQLGNEKQTKLSLDKDLYRYL